MRSKKVIINKLVEDITLYRHLLTDKVKTITVCDIEYNTEEYLMLLLQLLYVVSNNDSVENILIEYKNEFHRSHDIKDIATKDDFICNCIYDHYQRSSALFWTSCRYILGNKQTEEYMLEARVPEFLM